MSRDWVRWFVFWLASVIVSLMGVWIIAAYEAHDGRPAFALPLEAGAFYLFAVVLAAKSAGEYLYVSARQSRALYELKQAQAKASVKVDIGVDAAVPVPSEGWQVFVWFFLVAIVGIVGALYVQTVRGEVQSDREWLWAVLSAGSGTIYSFFCGMVTRYLR